MKSSLVESIKSLPALPKTIVEMQRVCANPESGINDLVLVVEKDPMIVANLLKAANSPLYCFGKEIKSVSQAVSLFGMSMTRSIAIGNSVRKLLNVDMEPYGITSEKFADISNQQAVLMHSWYSKIDRKKMENLFLASFLQETGKIIIASDIIKEGLLYNFKSEIETTNNIPQVEFSYVEETTATVTAAIFEHWKFEPTFVEMIRFSDSYQKAPEEIKEYATALNIVKTIAPINAPFSEQSITFGLRKAHDAGYDHEMLEDIIDNVLEQLGIVSDY
ncbi:MAG: HDOD domain-containing protein [Campylobacterales bacterium]|nr:HDOD domain-containing protein [Campylobacterales bacterium]